jgi:hypothetical protein
MRDFNECRPYIEHLISEHRRLHRLLRQARVSIVQSGGPDGDVSFADVARVLQNLRGELEHHFAEEEAGGCLDEAVSRCPNLSAELRRIETEHPKLLAAVDRLIAQARRCDCNAHDRIALNLAFECLCRQLAEHEVAENKVLKQGFGTNLNGDENGHPALTMDI